MKRSIFLICCIICNINIQAIAQVLTPVKWSYGSKKLNEKEAIIFIKASIDRGWHIYSTKQKDGGPVKTTILFYKPIGYSLIGEIGEPKPVVRFEKSFGIAVRYFENEVIFTQKIRLQDGNAVCTGKINFMVCNDRKCLPPADVDFSIPLNN